MRSLPKPVQERLEKHLERMVREPKVGDFKWLSGNTWRGCCRARFADAYRLIFRFSNSKKRIELLRVGYRNGVYSGGLTSVGQIRQPFLKPETQTGDSPEDLPLFNDDELFALGIPQQYWAALGKLNSPEMIDDANIPETVARVALDYLTSPAENFSQKLYQLKSPAECIQVAEKTLIDLIIELDPDQKSALRLLKDDGPYLLKGPAGTGKSLVGLNHLADLIQTRATETLFDAGAARYGVITYTTALVQNNRQILTRLLEKSSSTGVEIEVNTLDRICYHIAKQSLGRDPNVLTTDAQIQALGKVRSTGITFDSKARLANLDSEFLLEEIEDSIIGNDLHSCTEYIELSRRGSKVRLNDARRQAIWELHQSLAKWLNEIRGETFPRLRVIAKRFLEANPQMSRFKALLVDEAQDLTVVGRQVCLALVTSPKGLIFASDTAQSIYTRYSSWLSTDKRLDFRRRRPISLKKSYRSSKEIGQAISLLRDDVGDDEDRSEAAIPVFNGPLPSLVQTTRLQSDVTAEIVAGLPRLFSENNDKFNFGQVAIILRYRWERYTSEYVNSLEALGIKARVITPNKPLNMSGDSVHIITAYSAKGLTFPFVIVPDVNAGVYPSKQKKQADSAADESNHDEFIAKQRRLLYVALSRAGHGLWVVTDPHRGSPFLTSFGPSGYWNIEVAH